MRFWKVDLALAVIVLFALGLAAIQGRGRNAEASREFFARSAPSLERIPQTFGSWRMEEEDPLSERVLSILQCEQHVNRTYVDDETGARIMLTALLGPAGPLVAHSPEVCLPSAQFDMLSASEPIDILTDDGKRKLTLLHATFRSRDISQQVLHMYYVWVRPDGTWIASQSPRWELGGEIGLWKLQFATFTHATPLETNFPEDAASEDNELEQDAVVRFLQSHGETLRAALVVPSEPNS